MKIYKSTDVNGYKYKGEYDNCYITVEISDNILYQKYTIIFKHVKSINFC